MTTSQTAHSLLSQLSFYCPTFNSLRRLAECTKLQEKLQNAIKPSGVDLDFVSTDCNLYLAMAHLLAGGSSEASEDLKVPASMRDVMSHQLRLESCEEFGKWLGDEATREYY